MKVREWLEAHRAGKVVHDWTELELTHGKHAAIVRVSADSGRVQRPDGRQVRGSAGAYAVQQMAGVLGGHMLTAKLIEMRHLAATVILEPILAPWIEPGGSTATTTAAEASRAIDESIQLAQPFIGWGERPAQAKAGPWMVSNTCKPFCLDAACTDEWAVNHGWMVHESQVQWKHNRGDGKPGHMWVRAGTPCWPAVSAEGWYVLQRRGRAHRFGATAKDQDDYASHLLVIHAESWVDGQAGVATEKLYTTRELCGLVLHDGQPLSSVRHPGVPYVVGAQNMRVLAPTPSLPLSGSSDPELMWGARMVEWMDEKRENGVREVPDGSNNGPAISVWLGRSIRERVGREFGPWLAKTGGPWCAASASGGAAFETHMAGDGVWPFLTRASGFEMEEDAKRIGVWWAVETLLDGSVELEPGDVCVLPRGTPGGWQRHVCLFVRYVDRHASPPMIETIGGNEQNRFRLTTRRLTDLLGVIPMPDGDIVRPQATSTTAVIEIPELVIEARTEFESANHLKDGDNLLLHQWDKITPQPWRPHDPHGVTGHTRQWWSVPSDGIYVLGESDARRTKGEPITLRKIVAKYGDHIEEASERTGVPTRLIAAMVTTEAGLNEKAERHEPHLNDYSFGAAQTLTETAWQMAHRLNVKQPDRPVPRGGDPDEWRAFLFDARISILLGAMYLAYNDERFGLQWDPVLTYAGYNAGSPLVRTAKPWGLAYYTYDRDKDGIPEYDAIDTYVAWYGDACAVYSAE